MLVELIINCEDIVEGYPNRRQGVDPFTTKRCLQELLHLELFVAFSFLCLMLYDFIVFLHFQSNIVVKLSIYDTKTQLEKIKNLLQNATQKLTKLPNNVQNQTTYKKIQPTDCIQLRTCALQTPFYLQHTVTGLVARKAPPSIRQYEWATKD